MSNKALVPVTDESGDLVVKPTVVQVNGEMMAKHYTFVQFRGRAMVQVEEPFPHFVPLARERFDRMAYPLLGGITRSRVSDVMAYTMNAAPDHTVYDHLILFGRADIPEDSDSPPNFPGSTLTVWDTRELTVTGIAPNLCVWRSPFASVSNIDQTTREHIRLPFIMSLAGGDPELYDDIMQSIAPMIMEKKPDGVIWWVGDGANGKSTLMDAIYRIFPGQLSSITVKRLTDGRDTPSLNGTLANIVKESSEGRVDDTEVYKSIGTHEDFGMHKFHSQESVTIRGNLHHIFSGNSIPAFNDKGFSARRRTFIIPFNQRFESDPNFEEKTFTPEFFGKLVTEMFKYANRIKRQGYRYKFSAKTLAAKAEYDTEANNAEEYATSIVADGVVGFSSFNFVRGDYESWCSDNGYVALGVGHMRRAVQAVGFERYTHRQDDGKQTKFYRLSNFDDKDLVPVGMIRPGFYTTPGFEPEEKLKPVVPDFHEPKRDTVVDKTEGW